MQWLAEKLTNYKSKQIVPKNALDSHIKIHRQFGDFLSVIMLSALQNCL
jgi:hypothetical protein